MQNADADGNGKIDMSEWKEVLKKSEDLKELGIEKV